jgi:aspartate kinase
MKEIIVAKFGGSSLANGHQFKKVRDIVKADSRRRYIVPSAPGKSRPGDTKVTDLLYLCHDKMQEGLDISPVFSEIEKRYQEICRDLGLSIGIEEVLGEIRERILAGASRDYLASRGEYLNGIILSQYLGFEFIDAKDIILFNDEGRLDLKASEDRIRKRLKSVDYGVIPGFYGADGDGNIVTFSRGGSDITGSIVASSVRASLYENWTDVSGFLVADPNIVKDAKTMEVVTYKELRELCYMGAPVLHEESIFPIKMLGIPINIKNTNRPEDKGTLIVDESMNPPIRDSVTGISGKKDFTVIRVEKNLMNSEIGFIRKLVSIFERYRISIEHIPSSIDSLSVVVSNSNIAGKLEDIIEEIKRECQPDDIVIYLDMALIAVVGRGMAKTRGISGSIFTALANQGVRIRMISQDSSELNIILAVDREDFDKTVETIYGVIQQK